MCYHHFCEHLGKGLIKVDSNDQIADTLTKALEQNNFIDYCRHMQGREPPMPFTKITMRKCCIYMCTTESYINSNYLQILAYGPYLGIKCFFMEELSTFPDGIYGTLLQGWISRLKETLRFIQTLQKHC